jgi:RNA polymerase sigma factor (sigma-70 family)
MGSRHRPWIFNIAIRMLGRRADAEDATQDVLVRALKSLHAFRGDSEFRTWLYRVAANHLLNVRRKNWIASQAIAMTASHQIRKGSSVEIAEKSFAIFGGSPRTIVSN